MTDHEAPEAPADEPPSGGPWPPPYAASHGRLSDRLADAPRPPWGPRATGATDGDALGAWPSADERDAGVPGSTAARGDGDQPPGATGGQAPAGWSSPVDQQAPPEGRSSHGSDAGSGPDAPASWPSPDDRQGPGGWVATSSDRPAHAGWGSTDPGTAAGWGAAPAGADGRAGWASPNGRQAPSGWGSTDPPAPSGWGSTDPGTGWGVTDPGTGWGATSTDRQAPAGWGAADPRTGAGWGATSTDPHAPGWGPGTTDPHAPPGWGAPPWGGAGGPGWGQSGQWGQWGPGGYAAPPSNSAATAGMVLGIVALCLFWTVGLGVLLGVLAVVFGGIGMSKAKRLPDRHLRGRGLAGVVTGLAAIVLSVGLVAVAIGDLVGDINEINTDPPDGVCDRDRFMQDPDC